MSDKQLPDQFKNLEPFAAEWALATEEERNGKRYASKMEEIQAFYDAMLAQIEDAITYLNGFPLHDMPEQEKRLFHMTLSFAEIAPAVETYGQPTVPYGYDPTHFPPEAASEDKR